MPKNVKVLVEEIVKPIVESLGYEYIETEFAKQGKDWILTVFIDGEGGIGLDDCETVSRAIDPVLDEKDFIEQAYFLSVSSVGLDRPLKTDKDFERNMDACVDIKLYKPVEGQKEISGKIIGYTKETLKILSANGAELSVELKDAAKISLHIDF